MNPKPKYSVEVRQRGAHQDDILLQTDAFRDALAEYERLTTKLAETLNTCSYDIVAFYVRDTGNYIPVVMSSVETKLMEY